VAAPNRLIPNSFTPLKASRSRWHSTRIRDASLHAGGPGFESLRAHHLFSTTYHRQNCPTLDHPAFRAATLIEGRGPERANSLAARICGTSATVSRLCQNGVELLERVHHFPKPFANARLIGECRESGARGIRSTFVRPGVLQVTDLCIPFWGTFVGVCLRHGHNVR
jgi:hypothetical protein